MYFWNPPVPICTIGTYRKNFDSHFTTSRIEVYKRIGKSVVSVCKKTLKG